MNEFIELPDDKGNVHHFRYRDLNSFRDGYFHYEPQGGFHTKLSATEIEDCINHTIAPTPPDALVEALTAFADPANWEWDSSGWTWLSDVKPRKLADAALAAHEKAVR